MRIFFYATLVPVTLSSAKAPWGLLVASELWISKAQYEPMHLDI